jgi:hypothetical protein
VNFCTNCVAGTDVEAGKAVEGKAEPPLSEVPTIDTSQVKPKSLYFATPHSAAKLSDVRAEHPIPVQ